jgi:hypothetical protein
MDLPGIEPGGAACSWSALAAAFREWAAFMSTNSGPIQRKRVPCRQLLGHLVVDVEGGWLARVSNWLREGLWLLQVETLLMGVDWVGDLDNNQPGGTYR